MMIIAKIKGTATAEELMNINKMLIKGINENALVYDSEHVDLFVITDNSKEEYHAL